MKKNVKPPTASIKRGKIKETTIIDISGTVWTEFYLMEPDGSLDSPPFARAANFPDVDVGDIVDMKPDLPSLKVVEVRKSIEQNLDLSVGIVYKVTNVVICVVPPALNLRRSL